MASPVAAPASAAATPVAGGRVFALPVGASFSDPSFADPSTLARFDGCLLVVNSQFSALQGQPQLPFTVSSVPVPAPATGTPAATPVATARC